jgi:geranylgeranyl diphosphate synthase type I
MNPPLARFREPIRSALHAALSGDGPLLAALRRHVGVADVDGDRVDRCGKLLRPSLLLLVAEVLGASIERSMPAAVALELIHGFSLIHDDIQDGDRTRRGRPALWTELGMAQAINAGDLLFAMALSVALHTDPRVSASILDASCRLIEGQALDLALTPASAEYAKYLRLIDHKTGALFACAFEAGALLSDADRAAVDSLRLLGQQLGRAYQMHDDVKDLLAKRLSEHRERSDVTRRRMTLPVVLGLDGSGPDAEALRALYDPMSSASPDAILGRLRRMRIPERAAEHLSEQVSRVRTLIEATPLAGVAEAEMKELLDALAPPRV